MKSRVTKAQARRLGLDLFGEVPVTREDVYAWLIAVADLDPASFRAFGYVQNYGVLNKIIRAKIDGTFDSLVEPAKRSGRMLELSNSAAVDLPTNHLGLGDVGRAEPKRLNAKPISAPHRSKEVIEQERKRKIAARRARLSINATMLARLPKTPPPLSIMLADIGSPSPDGLASAFGVSTKTARRWISEDKAPLPVLLSLFWLTRWGTSEIDAKAHNDAAMAGTEAIRLRNELESIRAQLATVGRIADFGAVNDPLPDVRTNLAAQSCAVPPLPVKREVPIVFNSLRRVPCADSGRPRRRA